MNAFKKLKQSDVLVVPYIANKLFNIVGNNNTLSSSYNIQIIKGKYTPTSSLFDPLTSTTSSGFYDSLTYDVIRQLYFSNFLTSSYAESGSFNNFNQSSLKTIRYFPTSSDILIISIPQNLYGSKIIPNTLNISGTFNIIDDGEGNLYSGSNYVGNIIYPHGLLIFTTSSFISSTDFTGSLQFKNEHIVYENEIRCLIREDELNYSQNPTISTDASGSLRDFATGSGFSYVTTVGLYNEQNELLAVAKMSQPVPMSSTTDMTFVIRYDT